MDRKTAVLMAMGFEMVGLVGVLSFIGRWFDNTYSWGGLGTAGGAVIGVIAWMIHLFVLLKSFEKDSSNEG